MWWVKGWDKSECTASSISYIFAFRRKVITGNRWAQVRVERPDRVYGASEKLLLAREGGDVGHLKGKVNDKVR